MPTYELSLVYRACAKPELKTLIKRTAEAVFAQDGIIRKMENMGTRPLPYTMRKDEFHHKEGSYFLMHVDLRPESLNELRDLFKRDIDMLRNTFFRLDKDTKSMECGLSEELLPAAYRPEVKRLIEVGRDKQPKKFTLNVEHYLF